MVLSRRHAVKRRSRWWLGAVIAGSVVSSLTVAAAAITLRMARLVLTPEAKRVEDVRVLSVDRRTGHITLNLHSSAILPGRYSLYFDGGRGYARVGEVVAVSEDSVTRVLLAELRGTLRRRISARVSAWFYESPADLGVPFSEVVISTLMGPAPAWVIPAETEGNAEGRSWVIQVHGRGVDRREPLRAIPVFHQAGYTSLLISYRNDGVAPASQDGQYALGDMEWLDIEAAIDFAVSRGARNVVLMGWSMGGAIVLQAQTRSRSARHIRGIILDSPVVDWVRVLEHQAGTMKVPRVIRSAVYKLISSSWGARITGQAQPIDLPRLDFVHRAAELSVPMLLMHSDSDPYVPIGGSRELARLRPDLVSYRQFHGPGHTRLWNYDEVPWVTAISGWLSRLS